MQNIWKLRPYNELSGNLKEITSELLKKLLCGLKIEKVIIILVYNENESIRDMVVDFVSGENYVFINNSSKDDIQIICEKDGVHS